MAEAVGAERWAAIRRLYEGDTLTVAEIGVFAGISTRMIRRVAQRDGWRRRPIGGLVARGGVARAALRLADEAVRSPVPMEDAKPTDRRLLVDRLWAAIERHMAEEEAGAGADDPRRPQTLDILVRTIERLSGMEAAAAREPAQEAATPDTAALRAELLRRIEGLLAEG